jgi:hypothetical protein
MQIAKAAKGNEKGRESHCLRALEFGDDIA